MSKHDTDEKSQGELVFEVALLTRPGRPAPRREDVLKALSGVEDLRFSSSRSESRRHRYENPETQVAFDFVQYPADHRYLGLSFEMELPRPIFFALEALPVVTQVARELNADIEVLSPDNDLAPCEPTFELLIDAWQKANRDEVELLASEGRPWPRLSNQALEGMWEFMLLRAELGRRYGRSHVQLPAVELMRDLDSGQVVRVVRWNRLKAVALADCDMVLLEDPPAPLVHHSLVSFADLRERARFACRDLSQPVFHRLFDKAKLQGELITALTAVEGRSLDDYEPWPFRAVTDENLTPLMDS